MTSDTQRTIPPFIRRYLAEVFAALIKPGFRAASLSLLLMLLMLTATLWLWHLSQQRTMSNAEARFAFKVMEVEAAISERLTAYEQILLGGVGLFAASQSVERDEWHNYINNFNIESSFPGIRGIGYAQVIAPADLDEHIAAIRAEGFADYKVHPEGVRDSYTAIVYLEPFDWRNQRAFGYDMFSEPVRHVAMLRARDSGQPAVSGRVTLLQETSEGVQHGFLMYLPFYRGENDTVDARQKAIQGYVYAPFRMNDLMEGTLGREPVPEVQLQIYDDGRQSPDTLMYDSAATSQTTGQPQAKSAQFSQAKEFVFNGRHWLLQFTSLPAFEAEISTLVPKILLLGGILISLLFSAVFWSLSLNRQRAMALSTANQGLETEIAERVRLQAKLIRAKEAAEQASQAKSDFLANVSHELRTPLTLILSPLDQLTGKQHPPSDWAEQIARIQRNALHLLNRVNEVLNFSKAEAGKFEQHLEDVAIGPLIQALMEDAQSVAQSKGCHLSKQIDARLDKVHTDRRHLETIILNYLSNALKFTPRGGSIQLKAKLVEADQFELKVTDSGAGIPPELQGLLFQRFSQLDNSATRHHGGTGIGLVLVKHLAELMGGDAGVISEGPNKGSSFYVRLPRHSSRLSDTAQLQESWAPREIQLRRAKLGELAQVPLPEPTQVTSRPGQDKHILVVDDNPEMRSYLAQLLTSYYQVVTATDGQQAWSLLENQAFDLVLSDVMMPKLDGFDLTVRLKQTPQLAHLPVILLTARGGTRASAAGLTIGADDYIAKPFSSDELLARVAAALRMAKIQETLRQAERSAGSALMASTLLHNLGNILNGVTVPLSIITDKLHSNPLAKLADVVKLLQQQRPTLPLAIQQIPEYLQLMVELQAREHHAIQVELDSLQSNLEQAVQIIRRHQGATTRGNQLIIEPVGADSLLEKALDLVSSNLDLQGIDIQRQYAYQGMLNTDKNLILQVLVNLIINAVHAMRQCAPSIPCLRLETQLQEDKVSLRVMDNGEGISPSNLSQLFDQKFTTKVEGHGFGLHTGALWVKQLGGTLSAESDGVGQGATFIINLPRQVLDLSTQLPITETQT